MTAAVTIRLIPDQRCSGCGACNTYCDENTLLCCFCLGLKLNIYVRVLNLTTTAAERFAERRERWARWLEELWGGR
jgi:hypothetical protein